MSHRIFLRNKSRQRFAEVQDVYSQMEILLNFNDIGRWTLDLPAKAETWRGTRNLAAETALADGIVVVQDGITQLSGPITGRARSESPDRDTIRLIGEDDLHYLAGRVVLPVSTGPPYTANEYHTVTSQAENVMRTYVSIHAGASAKTERQVPGLTLAATANRGISLTEKARFDNLVDVLRRVALKGGDLGFRVVQVGTNLEFQVYAPVDRTKTAILSRGLGNIESIEYTQAKGEANYVIAGGGGEGTARTFQENGDAAAIIKWGRHEMFLDQRHTSDLTELSLAITEELERASDGLTLGIVPTDTVALQYGRDYGLGDKVTVVVDGASIVEVVRAVSLRYSPEGGEEIVPIIGTPDRTALVRLFERIRNLNRRLGRLERR